MNFKVRQIRGRNKLLALAYFEEREIALSVGPVGKACSASDSGPRLVEV